MTNKTELPENVLNWLKDDLLELFKYPGNHLLIYGDKTINLNRVLRMRYPHANLNTYNNITIWFDDIKIEIHVPMELFRTDEDTYDQERITHFASIVNHQDLLKPLYDAIMNYWTMKDE